MGVDVGHAECALGLALAGPKARSGRLGRGCGGGLLGDHGVGVGAAGQDEICFGGRGGALLVDFE